MKKTFAALLLCAVFLACLPACASADTKNTAELFAMDTEMTLTAYGKNGKKGLAAAEEEIRRLDALLSVGQEGSDIAELDGGKTNMVSGETAELIEKALAVSRLTGGAYDCTVYPLVSAWGFFSGDYRVPSDAEIRTLLKNVGWEKVSVDGNSIQMPAGTKIDLGGIGKGYASAQAIQAFKDAGAASGIRIARRQRARARKKPDGSNWSVAIEDPDDPGFVFRPCAGRGQMRHHLRRLPAVL